MELNFVDRTAQILFSDLLRRSDDLTDARIKAIAETAFRRAVMLAEIRKDYVEDISDPVLVSNTPVAPKVDWTEYQVQDKQDQNSQSEENTFECECACEEKKEESSEVKTSNEEPKKKRTWTRRTDKVKIAAATTSDVVTEPKKKGRPKGSGKKNPVV